MALRIYVSGQRAFGAAVADLVRETGHQLVGVASPEFSSGRRLGYPDGAPPPPDRLRLAAARHNVPWTSSERLIADSIPKNTDVIVAAHSHAFIGARTRSRASIAAIGYHPSLLPVHRGRDAIRWTIRDGDRVTGGSVYHLTNAVDGGPLAAQSHVFVPPDSTPESLWRDRLFPLGLQLLSRVFADLANGRVVCVPQDHACATWEPSWERPPLFRPELPELVGPASALHYDADFAALDSQAANP